MSGVPPSSSGQSRRSNPAPLSGVLRTLGLAAFAYLAVAGLYGLIEAVTSIPSGPLWNEALKIPAFFVLMLVAMVVLLVPLFRSDSDAAARQFSLLASSLFVVYATMRATHFGQPDAPLQVIVRYAVEPLRASILH